MHRPYRNKRIPIYNIPMKIGLVGSGGREHALVKALAEYRARNTLYVYGTHTNPGIEPLVSQTALGKLTDLPVMVDFFLAAQVDYVVVGPEAPLMAGAVDALRARGIPTVGPTQSQARLEGDKGFMRELLDRRVGRGSPAWRLVESRREAADFIATVGQIAVKPVGLTGGKGVQVMGVHLRSEAEALQEIENWLARDGAVLLEERLVGEEFSRMVLVSDGAVVPMPVCQDFKYAYDGDEGNMTGGMGVYTHANGSMPFLQPSELEEADSILRDTLQALSLETGLSYRGFLYGQFMITRRGIRVIEFNARLGDPEAINVLALLRSDAPVLFHQLAVGDLAAEQAVFATQASVCKYLVPVGYPDQPSAGEFFSLDENQILDAGFSVVCASVARAGADWRTLGSRTLALVGLGDEPGPLSDRMETLLARIEPPALRHRKDVGSSEVIEQKTARMASLRASPDTSPLLPPNLSGTYPK